MNFRLSKETFINSKGHSFYQRPYVKHFSSKYKTKVKMNINNSHLKITQWAEEDRPREKLLKKGASALTNAELLAILIGSGNQEESAVSLMQRVLSSCNNSLNSLSQWHLKEFLQFKGLGVAKGTALLAALEIAKRKATETTLQQPQIRYSDDIYKLFQPQLRDLTHEELWLLLLNQANKVLDSVKISSGGIDGTYADIRIILKQALLYNACNIVLIHNHPSGNCTPSSQDKELTKKIYESAQLMNIHLLDHLIIGQTSYYSFSDESFFA